MSNIVKLLNVADNVAFSNLFDVEIGASESAIESFNIHLESITIDGVSLDFSINEATKQHQLNKANKVKTVSFRVREKNNYYFYQYLWDWYLNFYDPIKNYYIKGSTDNSDRAIEGSSNLSSVVKRRTVKLLAYGSNEKNNPQMSIQINSAMIQKIPAISFDYTSSKPITYEVSLVCDNIGLKLPRITSGNNSDFSTPSSPPSFSTRRTVEDSFSR